MKPNEGSITIFKNLQHKPDDRLPEYRGGVMLNGKIYDIGLWVFETSDGRKFFSGSIKEIGDKHIKPTE